MAKRVKGVWLKTGYYRIAIADARTERRYHGKFGERQWSILSVGTGFQPGHMVAAYKLQHLSARSISSRTGLGGM